MMFAFFTTRAKKAEASMGETKRKAKGRYNFDRAVNTAVAVLRGKSTAISPKSARATIRLAAELGRLKTGRPS